jgi:hypothetical protein
MRGNQKNRGGRVVAYLMLLALCCNGSFAYDLKRGDYEFFDDDDNDDNGGEGQAFAKDQSRRPCIQLDDHQLDLEPFDDDGKGNYVRPLFQTVAKKAYNKFKQYMFDDGSVWNETKYRRCPDQTRASPPTGNSTVRSLHALIIRAVKRNIDRPIFLPYVDRKRVRSALKTSLVKQIREKMEARQQSRAINRTKVDELVQKTVMAAKNSKYVKKVLDFPLSKTTLFLETRSAHNPEAEGKFEALHIKSKKARKMAVAQLMPWTERKDIAGDTEHLALQLIYHSPCLQVHEGDSSEDFDPNGHALPKSLQNVIKSAVNKYSKYNFDSGKKWNQTKYRPCSLPTEQPSASEKMEASLINGVKESLSNNRYEPYVNANRVRKALKKALEKKVSYALHPTPRYHINSKKIETLIQATVDKRLREQNEVKNKVRSDMIKQRI